MPKTSVTTRIALLRCCAVASRGSVSATSYSFSSPRSSVTYIFTAAGIMPFLSKISLTDSEKRSRASSVRCLRCISATS